jgi:integrase
MKSKLKYVVWIKNRHGGDPYPYFTNADGKLVRMHGQAGSPELLAQHQQLLAARNGSNVVPLPSPAQRQGDCQQVSGGAAVPPPKAVIGFMAGSTGWVIDRYLASSQFQKLAKGTQYSYEQLLNIIKNGNGKVMGIGAGPIADLNRGNLAEYCGMIEEQCGTSRAKAVKTLLSKLWKFALKLPEAKISNKASNPTRDVEIEYSVSDAHHAWPQDVQDKFLKGAPAYLRLAFMLARYTGQRRSDIIKMKWSDYDEKNGVLHVLQKKTGMIVPVAVDPELATVLAETLRAHQIILLDSRGTPYKGDGGGLTHAFGKRLRALGFADEYALHGLRKTFGVAAAEAGCSTEEIMRSLGHATPTEAHNYCKEASKLKLTKSAMAKMVAAREVA